MRTAFLGGRDGAHGAPYGPPGFVHLCTFPAGRIHALGMGRTPKVEVPER